MPLHRDVLPPASLRRPDLETGDVARLVPPARVLVAATTAVLAVGLLAACTPDPDPGSGPEAPADAATAEDLAGGSGPAAQGEDHAAHGDHADHGSQVPVGPLALPAAEYWSVLQPADGVTQVRAGGCPEDVVCPSFEILSGAALDGVDPTDAHVPDGATCPGTDGLAARAVEKASETDAEVAGEEASLAHWTLSCVDAAGSEVRAVEQLQWYVPDAPGGPVLVVDRWAFEGLGSRLAAGDWSVV